MLRNSKLKKQIYENMDAANFARSALDSSQNDWSETIASRQTNMRPFI